MATTPSKTIPFDMGRGLSRVTTLRSFLSNDGQRAHQILRVASNVADGERVTIGSDVFEVDIINTSSGVTLLANLNNTDTSSVVGTSAAPSPTWVVGDLIKIDNEIMRVTKVNSTTSYTVRRAACGTSIATHTATTSISESDTPGTIVAAGRIPLGLVTTLTPAVFSPALAAEINANAGTDASSAKVVAVSLLSGAALLISADATGALALATTETLAGANNVWNAATMTDGADPGQRRFMAIARTVTATDVALDNIYIPLDFTPTVVMVNVLTSSGVVKAWDGARSITAPSGGFPAYITIGNGGTSDWAATDVLHIVAFE